MWLECNQRRFTRAKLVYLAVDNGFDVRAEASIRTATRKAVLLYELEMRGDAALAGVILQVASVENAQAGNRTRRSPADKCQIGFEKHTHTMQLAAYVS